MSFDLLTAYRPATPSVAEREMVMRVHRFIEATCGLRPLPHYGLEWFTTSDDLLLPAGFTHPGSPVRVEMRVGLTPRDLVACSLHELFHVWDTQNLHLFVGEREERAARFTAAWMPVAARALGLR